MFITWTNDPFFIDRTCTGWATNRICVLFSTCFGLPRTLCHVPPISNRRSSPSTTTVLQTQTARAVAPNHHTHCKSTVRLFHSLRVQFSRRPPPTPFHPSSLLFQRFAFRSYRWLRPPSLPSVPHEKFDQPPDCLYTFRLMTPCPISAVNQAQAIPCKTTLLPCNQRYRSPIRKTMEESTVPGPIKRSNSAISTRLLYIFCVCHVGCSNGRPVRVRYGTGEKRKGVPVPKVDPWIGGSCVVD